RSIHPAWSTRRRARRAQTGRARRTTTVTGGLPSSVGRRRTLGTPERPVKRATKSGHENLEVFSRFLAAGPRQRREHGLSEGGREFKLHAGGRKAPVAQVGRLVASQVGILMRAHIKPLPRQCRSNPFAQHRVEATEKHVSPRGRPR